MHSDGSIKRQRWIALVGLAFIIISCHTRQEVLNPGTASLVGLEAPCETNMVGEWARSEAVCRGRSWTFVPLTRPS